MNSVCLTFCLLLLSPFATKTFSQPPDPSQIPEPQIAYALHATWDPDLTDNNPSICTISGTVAVPFFHFYAGWKDGAPAFFSVDWVLIEELTNEHQPQVWYFESPQGESGFPYGCTMPPVNDPENWNWTTWSFAPMIGFAMHNTAYRVTVQWRYSVYMKGQRGPFQTSITINVQNLVVTSPDVGRVLRWDPEKGIVDTSFSYNIECAQRKQVQVTVRIYDMNRNLVYEVTEQKICPGSYSFTWDGTINTGYYGYPPGEGSNIAPAGLYTFDVEVIANPYDRDAVRSQALSVVPGPVEYLGYDDGGTPEDESDDNYLYYLRWYALYSGRDASFGEIWLYDPELEMVKIWIVPVLQCVVHEDCDGLTANPNGEIHGVIISVPVSLMEKAGTYRFVLHFYDDYADSYKNHQVKAALEVNQQVNRPLPIVWISGSYANTTWYGIWCRDPSTVRRLTHYEPRGTLVINWVHNNISSAEVKGACNGGFFTGLTLVGHVEIGTGWVGNDISTSSQLDRYAFGMRDRGRSFSFNILPMDISQQGNNYVYSLPSNIRQYPYGLSGIGLLVDNGQGRGRPNEGDNSPFLGRTSRTAIAWSNDRMHFFLIVATSNQRWTWDNTINFFTQELLRWMRENLPI
ncbi:MAG: hypothetical protein SQA66_04345 [Candidatus Fervidibacter sacchari]